MTGKTPILRFARSFLLLLGLTFSAQSSFAGDFATRAILGFSADGSRFAFEEYGRQDGSGFPYSNIYVIDTASDQWTGGSPFRVTIEDEAASIENARQQARNSAAGQLAAITEPGTVNATNQPLELPADSKRMAARAYLFTPPTSDSIEFRLETQAFPGEEFCMEFGGPVGFTLLEIATAPGRETRVLHKDDSVPQSRTCPLDYHFADIVTYQPAGAPELVAAILILMERRGFEGPDGRYLAVTTRLSP